MYIYVDVSLMTPTNTPTARDNFFLRSWPEKTILPSCSLLDGAV